MAEISTSTTPRMPRGVRLRFDPVRGAWVLLAPERVVFPDPIAIEILERCTGQESVEAISVDLARAHGAPLEDVRADVLELVIDLAERGLLEP